MNELLYIKEYYHYIIVFISCCILFSYLSYFKKNNLLKLIDILAILFSLFTVFYIGQRDVTIGTDTKNYKYSFNLYQSAKEFEVDKDAFYDFTSYIFAKFLDFESLLIFCAFIYVFGAWYGLRLIFKKEYYIPFLIFFIYPYFFLYGINGMRNGVATSIFLVGLGFYYNNDKKWKIFLCLVFSCLFHLSLLFPFLAFLITRYFKKTEFIFVLWIGSLLLSVMNINFVYFILSKLDFIASRFISYTVGEGEKSTWINFFIFGAFPVLWGVYNVIKLRYNSKFYTQLLNTYMLVHIPYIVLINTQFALRIGYLSEFMMPILLFFPLIINPVIKIKFYRFKYCILILFVFLIKAYKVLILN